MLVACAEEDLVSSINGCWGRALYVGVCKSWGCWRVVVGGKGGIWILQIYNKENNNKKTKHGNYTNVQRGNYFRVFFFM